MADRFLQTLGLARRAGRAVYGIETVTASARDAILILLAKDAGNAVSRRAGRLELRAGAQILAVPYTRAALGRALGVKTCAAAAVTEQGFADNLQRQLQEPDANYSQNV